MVWKLVLIDLGVNIKTRLGNKKNEIKGWKLHYIILFLQRT
jgi:hypothetical protein